MVAPRERLDRQRGVEQEIARGREAGLHRLACDDIPQAMPDEGRPRSVEESQRLRDFVAGLERMVDRLVIVQPGIAVPGEADEPRLTAEDMEALERFRMPAAGPVGGYVVAMD